MSNCPLCENTGVLNEDLPQPEFCYCVEGRRIKREWENSQTGKRGEALSFINLQDLEQVNANVDAMRATLFGNSVQERAKDSRHAAVQLLYKIAKPGHEITVRESTQLHDLARLLENFLQGLQQPERKR